MRQGSRRSGIGTLVLLSSVAGAAQATYSITAVDRARGEVGGAGTSCISGSSVYRIYGSSPGVGAVNSQAWSSAAGRDEAVRLLEQGIDPAEIVLRLTDPGFDVDADLRQYGIVDLMGRAAGHSGAATQAHSSDLQGSAGSFVYSIQGNILTGRAVLTQARDAFEGGGCDLADRLMRALEGGADQGEGDSRCTPDEIPSDAAYIQVDLSDAPRGSFLRLEVRDTAPASAVSELRVLYDAWRRENACPSPEPADAAVPDTGVPDGAPPADAGDDRAAPAPEGAADNDAGAADATPDASPAVGASDGGCGCRAGTAGPGTAPLHWTLVAGAFVLAWSRARRRR